MIEWLNSNIEYWHWLVLGMALVIMEIFTSGFIVFWFGISALVLSLVLLVVDMPFQAQLMIWVVLALVAVFIWFKFIKPGWKDKTTAGMGREALTAQIGTVMESNTGKNRGKLKFPAPILGEDEWIFICDEEIEVGARVKVNDVSGNTLMVNRY
ncbi:MAG: hypothetical protein CSB48_12895 [Proteobacteria bacterium]|nr:MAG: hypothetical protein CSB48_12895 [Pseudomonadota bacterium]PIE40317.1 MAG: hypothetical protein CSA51_01395 [Gammaproteobacteria bacterium]